MAVNYDKIIDAVVRAIYQIQSEEERKNKKPIEVPVWKSKEEGD